MSRTLSQAVGGKFKCEAALGLSAARCQENREAKMTSSWIGGVSIGAVLMLPGCSDQPQKVARTEQQIHAGDSAVASGAPRIHLYQCDDDRTLFVNFKDKGLTVKLRHDAWASAVVLTAPSQGLPYIGESIIATFSGNHITIKVPGKRPVICQKQVT